MAKASREDGLSRERIVDAATELLDAEGEDGLTFRALAARLTTGAGAIYWHVANKSELLVAATDAVVLRALSEVPPRAAPRKTLRNIAGCLFDAIDAHPWVGAQLFRAPTETASLQILERIGREIQALGAAENAQFTAASALVSYIIGVSAQNAANARAPVTNREAYLDSVAARWMELDAREYPFLRTIVPRLRDHDDRAEFLAGVDLILAGIVARS